MNEYELRHRESLYRILEKIGNEILLADSTEVKKALYEAVWIVKHEDDYLDLQLLKRRANNV